MELAVYFSELSRLGNLDEALRPLDAGNMPGFVSAALARDECGAEEYVTNCTLGTFLSQLPFPARLARLYFGQEFCEHLVPEPDELRQAYYMALQMGWEFTYVTGYVTDAGLARIAANLEALAAEQADCEVLVNDWGILRLLRDRFPGFRPILGRLLNKQLRVPRFTDRPPPAYDKDIQAPILDIQTHQIEAMRQTNLGFPGYADLLRRQGVCRAEIDPVPQGLDPGALPSGLPLSVYAPWTFAAGGRTCRTAALADPRRQFVVLDSPCPRPCRRVNRSLVGARFPQPVLLRGNSAFIYNLAFIEPYLDGSLAIDRLVVQPYIPI